MEISLDTIQSLAPDQASLSAAKKLLQPAKWPVRGQAPSVNSIWGQCQGSGSTPYYTMADVCDHGYKCTCPSRKFPCKHVLALLWQFSNNPSEFTQTDPPDWVNDWLGRRRKSESGKNEQSPTREASGNNKHLSNVDVDVDEKVSELDAVEAAKKAAAQLKRAEKQQAATQASIRAGLTELRQWLEDQFRTGVGNFITHVNDRCRQIAARLVDAKATNLAARIDQFPAKVLSTSPDQQPETVLIEFGRWVVLIEAWLANPLDPDAKRSIGATESRDQLLAAPNALHVNGVWETLGDKVETRRDGLVSHSRWLLQIDADSPQFALIQDYYPASLGGREQGFHQGTQIKGELVFYPSRMPLRAIIGQHEVLSGDRLEEWAMEGMDLYPAYNHWLSGLPWGESFPHLLGRGRVVLQKNGRFWWQCSDSSNVLALNNHHVNPVILGGELESCFIVWDGRRAELFAGAVKNWGLVLC